MRLTTPALSTLFALKKVSSRVEYATRTWLTVEASSFAVANKVAEWVEEIEAGYKNEE